MRRRNVVAISAAAALVLTPLMSAPAHAVEVREQQYWLEDYGITEAWDTTRGEGVTIAIIDTGVDGSHPGLNGALTGGTDFSGGGDGSGGPVQQTSTEHGTLVASLAVGWGEELPEPEVIEPESLEDMSQEEWDEWFDQFLAELEAIHGEDWEEVIDEELLDEFYEERTFPGMEEELELDDEDLAPEAPDVPWNQRPVGVVGVAPEANIISASLVLEDPNPNGPGTEEQIAQAVVWAVDNGADIINMSIGSGVQDWPESWDEAFLHAEENDVLVVAAAGNRAAGHWSVGAPATIPGVLTVAGVDENRNISEESSSQGIAVDIAAASEPLVGALPGEGYATWTGTSGATPLVAGAAALVMAAHPELSAQEVKHRLLVSADSEGAEGVDPEYGHGVLNVAEAVNGNLPEFNADDYDTLADWIRVHRRADDGVNGNGADIPEDAEVIAGPEGEPRELPRAAEVRSAQDWAGPVTVAAGGLVVVILMTLAAVHLISRRSRT